MENRLTESDQRPLLLLDGMSLVFRAFYALNTDLATSAGVVTNALHGFASMLNTLIRNHEPRSLVVAFDLPGGTFRDQLNPEYKGGRAPTPPELDHQFDLVRDLCAALAIPVIGVPGYEADDVLATLATWGRDQQIPTIVVTGDRDSFQLVEDPYVRVLYNKRGVSDYDLYDEAGIMNRCGVEPARYQLLAALRGDPSDNLPGVPGVGEKTAAKLLSKYRDFDQLFAATGEQTPKLRENLEANETLARKNAEIMQLVRTVPIDVDPSEFHLGDWRLENIHAFFERFEMSGMKSRFNRTIKDGLLGAPSLDSAEVPESDVPQGPNLVLAEHLEDVTTDTDLIVAVSGHRVAVANSGYRSAWIGSINDLFAGLGDHSLSGHDVKSLYRRSLEVGLDLAAPRFDSALAAYLLDASNGQYGLAEVASRFLGLVPSRPSTTLFDDDVDDESLLHELKAVVHLRRVLEPEIERMELTRVMYDIELPLVRVLARMEHRGVAVDRSLLTQIIDGFTTDVGALDQEIQELAGHPFKVNSPQQLQVVLFDELHLTKTKKIKTGFSTDATSLESIVGEHAIVEKILRFRELDKLRGTYGAPLLATVRDDDRIHATFHQTVARTGRLSSEAPNLHNIPVRGEEGRKLRHAFVPRSGWRLLVADYDQIELRILAHLSHDPGLLGAFASGSDVHRAIAARVFGVTETKVTKTQREQAKAVSYGLAYGMESFGLSQRLGIPVSDAKAIMDQYFTQFPRIREYTDEIVAEVRANGFSRTEFGRIRPFPDLLTAVGHQRAAAERQAMNANIQGLAADIFKYALVRLDERLGAEGMQARLVLQVHDEVLVEAPAEEQQVAEAAVREALLGAATLSVPLEISLHWGDDWASAKG